MHCAFALRCPSRSTLASTAFNPNLHHTVDSDDRLAMLPSTPSRNNLTTSPPRVEPRTGSSPATVTSASPSLSSLLMSSTTSSRSEEHTSELQSLMRHPYAVFCLKKKN